MQPWQPPQALVFCWQASFVGGGAHSEAQAAESAPLHRHCAVQSAQPTQSFAAVQAAGGVGFGSGPVVVVQALMQCS